MISRNYKTGRYYDQSQPRLNKRDLNHDEPSSPNVKGEGSSSCEVVKSNCATCGTKHCGNCVVGSGN